MEVTPISSSAEEDKKLVESAKAGNNKSFETLMKKYKKSVYYMVFRMVRDSEDAEDITQDAFIKAFSSIHRFDPKFAFSTWLFKIASNNCIDFLRKKKMDTTPIGNGVVSDESGAGMQIRDNAHIPSEQLIRSQRKEFLEMAISNLPERFQILIDRRYFKEMSYEEVAEELKLPVGTVKAQLHRARELLVTELKKYDNYSL